MLGREDCIWPLGWNTEVVQPVLSSFPWTHRRSLSQQWWDANWFQTSVTEFVKQFWYFAPEHRCLVTLYQFVLVVDVMSKSRRWQMYTSFAYLKTLIMLIVDVGKQWLECSASPISVRRASVGVHGWVKYCMVTVIIHCFYWSPFTMNVLSIYVGYSHQIVIIIGIEGELKPSQLRTVIADSRWRSSLTCPWIDRQIHW